MEAEGPRSKEEKNRGVSDQEGLLAISFQLSATNFSNELTAES
jgi:hypothetical protein